jgi:hypothetical protein
MTVSPDCKFLPQICLGVPGEFTVARRVVEEDDWDDNGSDWEDDKFEDIPDDSEAATIQCPHCRRYIHEDSQRCPYCEHYISEEDAPPSRKSWWIILGTLLCLYIVYRWIVG